MHTGKSTPLQRCLQVLSADRFLVFRYFCPAFAVLRPPEMEEMQYVEMVRAGLVPWQSHETNAQAMAECQADWTVENMRMFAELFRKQGS